MDIVFQKENGWNPTRTLWFSKSLTELPISTRIKMWKNGAEFVKENSLKQRCKMRSESSQHTGTVTQNMEIMHFDLLHTVQDLCKMS